jgi:predicted AlkP superfamily pyrophosphatase or phosphodiesterase
MSHFTRTLFTIAVVAWCGGSCRMAEPNARTADTRLLVIVVVDQLRSEYLDRYRHFWKEGFARLLAEGAVFERAAYPYLNTVTCAGHATIGTGAFPSTHGVILNEWWHRETGRTAPCTVGDRVSSVVYGGEPERLGHSAFRQRVQTLADRLRETSPQARVMTLSLKPRSAIMLAGHGGTAVTWFGDTNAWATSTAFSTAPVKEVQAYASAHPVERYRDVVWDRVLDASAYSGSDDGMGERPPAGWTPLFPHPLAPATTKRDRFYELWRRSPFSDAELGEMAAVLVRSMGLGQRKATDFLGISFPALDYVGHDFGPDSHEVQDALIRLDRTLGKLMAALDETVGRNGYTLGLSADHGVGSIPEVLRAAGQDAGRVLARETRAAAEAALVAALGPGPHVAHVEYSELYLTDETRAIARENPQILQPLVEALERVPGVMRAFSTHDLPRRKGSEDAVERAAALGHFPGESGDVQIVLKPNWIATNSSATTHGTLHPYDQQVPVIFFGRGIAPGHYRDPATPADIAPTLGATIALDLPAADGNVLRSALGAESPQ